MEGTGRTGPSRAAGEDGGDRRGRRGTSRAAFGARPAPSRTVTIENDERSDEAQRTGSGEQGQQNSQTLVLRLRRRGVQWTEDTHDNEHDGKKSSKSCCIFHKQRAFDESSTESDEDRSDHSDDDSDARSDGSNSSSGGQRRQSNSAHVRQKLRELERLRMETDGNDNAEER